MSSQVWIRGQKARGDHETNGCFTRLDNRNGSIGRLQHGACGGFDGLLFAGAAGFGDNTALRWSSGAASGRSVRAAGRGSKPWLAAAPARAAGYLGPARRFDGAYSITSWDYPAGGLVWSAKIRNLSGTEKKETSLSRLPTDYFARGSFSFHELAPHYLAGG
jgi:hypothetical protein